MSAHPRLFIVDFDNTLFDAEKSKNYISSKLSSRAMFNRIYKNAKNETGFFVPENVPENLRSFFLKVPFSKFLFAKTKENILRLQKLGKVVIFSYGDSFYQGLKIKKTGIEKIVGKENVIVVQNEAPLANASGIFSYASSEQNPPKRENTSHLSTALRPRFTAKADKIKGAEKLLSDIKKDEYSEVVFIDDVAEVLQRVYEKLPRAITIWIRYGKYRNKLPLLRNSVTFETASFGGAVDFIQRFVSTISPSKSHLKFSVLKNIDGEETKELIAYTGRDKKISACTHDDGRFKNKKTFTAWKSRGKTIYVLTGRAKKLLGIIWFARKKYDTFRYTLGIRIYPPLRGKGLSYKFLKTAFEDFSQDRKNPGYWLAVRKGNTPAEHLYKKYGFIKSGEKGDEIIMTLAK